MNPLFFVFSAPSGAGKTTLVRFIQSLFPDFKFSVSYTSRPPRAHEKDGHDYFFVSESDFRNKINEGFFVEWEEVYPGHFYGTPLHPVLDSLESGIPMLFDLDVRGGLAFKKAFPDQTKALFVGVSDISVLEMRLRRRQTESETKIRMRLDKARAEMAEAVFFDTVIPNDDLKVAQEALLDLFQKAGYQPQSTSFQHD
ncbi:MAG: guanylate kinase [Bacteroidia bacterium]